MASAAPSDLKTRSQPKSLGWAQQFLLFALFFAGLMLLHAPLLRLPYFWDEAGYYVPAARDLYLTGSLIPHSTPSNAHPPLVMAWLALAWRVAGYSALVTRTAMLALAAFSLLGLFRLSRAATNLPVAWATTALTAIYPVFFTQSSLAQVDLPAAGLTFWALLGYLEDRPWKQLLWFSLAALAKETAILAPLALFGWELIAPLIRRSWPELAPPRGRRTNAFYFLLPVAPLACWYAFHYVETGFVLGNPEFLRYNLAATLDPRRIPLALLMRIWQVYRIFRPLPAHSRGNSRNVPSCAESEQRGPHTNCDLAAGSLRSGVARISVVHVGGGRSGAGALLASRSSARDSCVGFDPLAARPLLEADRRRSRNRLCLRAVHQPALWIFAGRQSRLSRLHRDARGGQPILGSALSQRARAHAPGPRPTNSRAPGSAMSCGRFTWCGSKISPLRKLN